MQTVPLDTLYGQLPAYHNDNGNWRIPVNCAKDWATAVLTEQDWQTLEEEGTHVLSVCKAIVKPEEHPEGSDRGGYVLTATFRNVGYYKLDNHNELWCDECSLYYDEGGGEWC